jgi:adenylate cyclase
MAPDLPHKLAAILYADVAGYSRLTQLDEAGTHEQLSVCLDLMAERISSAGGRVIHYAGDAVLAEFESVIAATRCAIRVQEAIPAATEEYPEDRRIAFRIGINLGEVIIDRDELYGDAVNIAARLESLATPGGVCISDAVQKEIQGKIDVELKDLGAQSVKNIEQPVRAYQISSDSQSDTPSKSMEHLTAQSRILGTTSANESVFDIPSRQLPSVMILPFRCLGGNEDEAALVDGFRLSIHSVLVKLSGLFLVSGSTLEAFRTRDISASEAAQEAGVRYVLEGAAQIAGQRIRVTIQLTDASVGQVIWSDQFDRVLDDIFELQDEITTEVVSRLRISTHYGEPAVTYAWWDSLPNWRSREKALRGFNYFYKGTPTENQLARQEFEQLVEMHPEETQGLALIALTHWVEAFRGWAESPEDSIEKAVEIAEQAVAGGDQDGLGRMVLGHARLDQGKYEEALELSKSAAATRRSCPIANALYGRALLYGGDPEGAIQQMKHAIRTQRLYAPWMINILSEAYRDMGDIPSSIRLGKESLQLDEENADTNAILCADHVFLGAVEEARQIGQKLRQSGFSTQDYATTKPYRDRDKLDVVTSALREAGLP